MKLTSARDPHMQLNPKWGMGFAHSINAVPFCRLTYKWGMGEILDLGLTIYFFFWVK